MLGAARDGRSFLNYCFDAHDTIKYTFYCVFEIYGWAAALHREQTSRRADVLQRLVEVGPSDVRARGAQCGGS